MWPARLSGLIVDGWRVFLVDVFLHLVTADAEFEGIGGLHGGVEATPEYDAANEEEHGTANGGTQDHAAGHQARFLK